MLVWAGLAEAADLEGQLFGEPFVPAAALGMADPAQPGVLSVLVTPRRLTCDEARALRDGSKKKQKKPPIVLVAAFPELREGTTAGTILAMGPDGLAGLTGSIVLVTLPTSVGEKGALAVDLAANEAAKDGVFGGIVASEAGDRLQGDVTFELCDAVVARPSLAGTVFEATPYTVTVPSLFDSPPDEMAIVAPLPKGWKEGKDPLGAPQWTAPDGATKLSFDLSSPSGDLAAIWSPWAESQAKGFQTEATVGELVASRLAAEGAYVIRWRYRWGTGAWTNRLEVIREQPGWPFAVECHVEGSDAALAEVFDAAEQACIGLTVPATP